MKREEIKKQMLLIEMKLTPTHQVATTCICCHQTSDQLTYCLLEILNPTRQSHEMVCQSCLWEMPQSSQKPSTFSKIDIDAAPLSKKVANPSYKDGWEV